MTPAADHRRYDTEHVEQPPVRHDRDGRARRLTLLTHFQVGEAQVDGYGPPPHNAPQWRADTACGLRLTTTLVTKRRSRITCAECWRPSREVES